MMLQLNPPLPIETPKGKAWAIAMIDYGPQWEILWVTFVRDTGECWTFRNSQIRQGENYTFGHPTPSPISTKEQKVTAPISADAKNQHSKVESPVMYQQDPFQQSNLTANDHAINRINGNGHSNGHTNSLGH